MAPPPRTKPGKLSDAARHVVLPSGIVSTGWPAVRDKCAEFGVSFDPWQDGAGRVILAKRADGKYAASIGGVVISIPRQVGKTFLIGAIVFALCLLYPGLTVLWTAHRLRTANETFGKMQSFAGRRKVKPHVSKIVLGSGDQEIKFVNGSRILFGARERGFGRGFDDVDLEVFDEAQILTDNATDDMIPAMNTAANPLPIFMGTPPKPSDPADVFKAKRKAALSGDDEDTAYIELSADRDCDPNDRKQWGKANPSHPHRTPDSAMMRMKKNLTPESFVREGLGVWDDDDLAGELPNWGNLGDPQSLIESHRQWALAVSPDRKWASIGLAGRRADTLAHVGWAEHKAGTGWIVDAVVAGWLATKIPIRIHKSGPESAYISKLQERGVEVVEVSNTEAAQATGQIIDDVDNGEIRHLDQASMNKAVRCAVLRRNADGLALWSQIKSDIEITPLIACTIALGGVPETKKKPGLFFAVT